MGWLIKNGSYPYLEGVATLEALFVAPTPRIMWRGSAGGLPEVPLFPQMPAFGCFANAVRLQEVRYDGTMAQWNAVQLGSEWNTNAPFTQIACKDGYVPCR